MEFGKTCCICGQPLPTRYSVGGECDVEECDLPFCRFHWANSNHRCPEHGYEVRGGGGRDALLEKERVQDQSGLEIPWEESQAEFLTDTRAGWGERMKKSVRSSLEMLKQLGPGAKGLVDRIRGVTDPADLRRELDRSLNEITERLSGVKERLQSTHQEISEGKQQLTTVSPARKRILESELRNKLTTYQALQRRLEGLQESEKILNLAVVRLDEDEDNRMPTVTEDVLDDITDALEESTETRLDLRDAAAELEGAGAVGAPAGQADLDDLLADFGEEDWGEKPEPESTGSLADADGIETDEEKSMPRKAEAEKER